MLFLDMCSFLQISDLRRKFSHSTPIPVSPNMECEDGYSAPLPALPTELVECESSSESSSDEEEEEPEEEKNQKKERIYDEIPADLLKELTQEQKKPLLPIDTVDGQRNSGSYDSQSENSASASNRHSYSEPLASDDTGTASPKVTLHFMEGDRRLFLH